MNEADLLNEFNGKLEGLSRLIRSFNVIKPASGNEIDRLAKKILNQLYERQTGIKISRIIESELCLTYGLYKTEFDADQLTKEIITWWNE